MAHRYLLRVYCGSVTFLLIYTISAVVELLSGGHVGCRHPHVCSAGWLHVSHNAELGHPVVVVNALTLLQLISDAAQILEENEDIFAAIVENLQLGRMDECIK